MKTTQIWYFQAGPYKPHGIPIKLFEGGVFSERAVMELAKPMLVTPAGLLKEVIYADIITATLVLNKIISPGGIKGQF
jgi:hypothetical protein